MSCMCNNYGFKSWCVKCGKMTYWDSGGCTECWKKWDIKETSHTLEDDKSDIQKQGEKIKRTWEE